MVRITVGVLRWTFQQYTAPECEVPLTPVTPVTPSVAPEVGACVGGEWTITTPATISVPYVENGRFDVGAGFVPGGFDVPFPQGSELTIAFQMAEGNFSLQAAEGWYIENGTAYTTLTRPHVEPAECEVPVTPTPTPQPPEPTNPPTGQCPEGSIPMSDKTCYFTPTVGTPATPAEAASEPQEVLAETGEDSPLMRVLVALSALSLIGLGLGLVAAEVRSRKKPITSGK